MGIVGECNIQYAFNSDTDDYRVIEVNARLSRSSALASKATGYPLAFVAAKIALGYSLDQIGEMGTPNSAYVAPQLDYYICKIPRWDLTKFAGVSREIGSSMKSVGEIMSIGRSFEEIIQKGLRMIGQGMHGFVGNDELHFDDLDKELSRPTDLRVFSIAQALEEGYTIDRIHELTKIDPWFLGKLKNIVDNKALKPILEIYSQMVKDGTLVEVTDWDQYIASINNGTTAGVINGCWIMASITANEDQSGKWAITNMPKLDGVDGATNYSNNGGSSWAISSNCKKQDLAIDFMKSTFAGSTALYDDIIAKGALATWAPAGDSEAYAQPVAFFSDDPVYAKIVDFATKTPSNITGAFYYDARDAVGTALSNIIQTGADMDSELQTAQETVEFNMGG